MKIKENQELKNFLPMHVYFLRFYSAGIFLG
jgi:hypothetical protein